MRMTLVSIGNEDAYCDDRDELLLKDYDIYFLVCPRNGPGAFQGVRCRNVETGEHFTFCQAQFL